MWTVPTFQCWAARSLLLPSRPLSSKSPQISDIENDPHARKSPELDGLPFGRNSCRRCITFYVVPHGYTAQAVHLRCFLSPAIAIRHEVVWLDSYGTSNFEALHSRVNDERASACAFDLLMLNGDDIRRKPFVERKDLLRTVLRRTRNGIQYVGHAAGDGAGLFEAVCRLGLEGIVSKKLSSGPSKSWIKVKNPNAPAATRTADGTSNPSLRGTVALWRDATVPRATRAPYVSDWEPARSLLLKVRNNLVASDKMRDAF